MTDAKDNTKRCAEYKANSQNQNPKYRCVADHSVPSKRLASLARFLKKNPLPISEDECKVSPYHLPCTSSSRSSSSRSPINHS